MYLEIGDPYKRIQKRRLCYEKPLSEAEFLDQIQTEISRVFLLAIHSHLYSFALR